jgi:hypothetical protein
MERGMDGTVRRILLFFEGVGLYISPTRLPEDKETAFGCSGERHYPSQQHQLYLRPYPQYFLRSEGVNSL